jgi:predicted O-methyltransferase YrrM
MAPVSTVVLIRTVTAHPTSSTWVARLREVRTEARFSPTCRGVAAAICGAALFRASRWDWRKAASLGVASGIAQGALLRAEHRLHREIRNSGDAAAVALWLGSSTPPLGGWAIEPDFGRLIAIELADSPDVVVECGSGATTLLVANLLQRNGRGRLFTLEHDRAYAARISQQVQAAGLANVCEVIWAPLTPQSFGGQRVHWYDAAKVADLPENIDVVLVDGPPAGAPWARWPALETLGDRLTPGASVLVDDGRRREELRTVFRWQAEHDDLELHWHDTVKGTWRLVKSDGTGSPRRAVFLSRYLRYVRRRLNPRPQGYGRWPVER